MVQSGIHLGRFIPPLGYPLGTFFQLLINVTNNEPVPSLSSSSSMQLLLIDTLKGVTTPAKCHISTSNVPISILMLSLKLICK